MVHRLWLANTAFRLTSIFGIVARSGRGDDRLRRGRVWALCSGTGQPGDRDSCGDVPSDRSGQFRGRHALHHCHAYSYVIIVCVLFPRASHFRKRARGVFRGGGNLLVSMGHASLLTSGLFLASGLAGSAAARAQDAPPNPEPRPAQPQPFPQQPAQTGLPGQVVLNSNGQCVQPPPMVELKDYNGPLHKVVGTFTQKLDRLSVHDPHYKPGLILCSLEVKDKFFLFLRDSVDPETFLAAGFNAGISQAKNDDPSFGQGGTGYGKRVGVSYIDQVQFRFFKEFAYPTLFSEDPRYYRLGQGAKKQRFLHAVRHAVVAYNDHGAPMFNFSEWMGEISGVSLANLYHPGAQRGFGHAAQNVAIDVASDIGYDELREFWPEIARKMHLPFRDENETQPDALPAGR
jgi:hypothetical protein